MAEKGGEGKGERGEKDTKGRKGPCVQPPPWASQNLGPALAVRVKQRLIVCVLTVSDYPRDQKRSKDASRGVMPSNTQQRNRSPHQIRDIPPASRLEPEWSSREANYPASRENPAAHGERESRRPQRDRRDVTRHETAMTSNNMRPRRPSHSDSSAGVLLSVCLCQGLGKWVRPKKMNGFFWVVPMQKKPAGF